MVLSYKNSNNISLITLGCSYSPKTNLIQNAPSSGFIPNNLKLIHFRNLVAFFHISTDALHNVSLLLLHLNFSFGHMTLIARLKIVIGQTEWNYNHVSVAE